MSDTVTDNTAAKDQKLVQLPLSRVRKIMKFDPDSANATHETVFLITKATELLIESMSKEASEFSVNSSKKTITRRHVDAAIEAVDALAFLEGTLD